MMSVGLVVAYGYQVGHGVAESCVTTSRNVYIRDAHVEKR